MSRRGRKASLPTDETRTGRGILDNGLVVRCFAQDGSEHLDFDFGRLPLASGLQRGLATAFARRTAPGSRMAALHSMEHLFWSIGHFARFLATLPVPPAELAELRPEHLDGCIAYLLSAVSDASRVVGSVKGVLLHAEGLSEALAAKLGDRNPPRVRGDGARSYSRAEFMRIAAAARSDLRAAAARIRTNRSILQRYRAGDLADADRRLTLLDLVDTHGDVPRYRFVRSDGTMKEPARDWVWQHGSINGIVGQSHLLATEAFAGAVLLAVMTGQNRSVIMNTGAAHHRADGHTGQIATTILDTHKPRRGRRAYMNLVLSQVPDWISIPERPDELSARDELHTPFGLYSLLIELTASSRRIVGTDKLFVGYHERGGGGAGRGLRVINPEQWYASWSNSHDLRADPTGAEDPVALVVRMDRIRMTYLELHQKPVAHRETTLAKDYLSRNRGSLVDYQKVVAAALAGEVGKARARGVVASLTTADLAAAHRDPDAAAARHGVDAATLERLLAGELDTVMAACIDDGTSSPHSNSGQPCQASFMQCLDCPCARALPHHLPIQVLVHDRIEARKQQLTPLAWAQRFGMPHAQLSELLHRHDKIDVDDARIAATDTDRALVERFLNRELDLR